MPNVEVKADLIYQTERAYKLAVGRRSVWLPKSQAEVLEHNQVTDAMRLMVPHWLARKNGLIKEQ